MKAFWTYTLARLGVLAATLLVLWAVATPFFVWSDLTVMLLLITALVVSSIISFFALAGMRDALAQNIEARAARVSERLEESRRAEDVD